MITHLFKARSSSPSKSLICGDRQGLNTENDNISQTNFAIYKTPGFPRSHLLSTTCLPSSRLSYFHLSVPESSLAAKIAWSASGRSLVSNTFITMEYNIHVSILSTKHCCHVFVLFGKPCKKCTSILSINILLLILSSADELSEKQCVSYFLSSLLQKLTPQKHI